MLLHGSDVIGHKVEGMPRRTSPLFASALRDFLYGFCIQGGKVVGCEEREIYVSSK